MMAEDVVLVIGLVLLTAMMATVAVIFGADAVALFVSGDLGPDFALNVFMATVWALGAILIPLSCWWMWW